MLQRITWPRTDSRVPCITKSPAWPSMADQANSVNNAEANANEHISKASRRICIIFPQFDELQKLEEESVAAKRGKGSRRR